MTIEELNEKHLELIRNPKGCSLIGKSHTKLSIQFAIKVLEELKQIAINRDFNYVAYDNLLYFKIQELKQYLDETNKD